MISAGGYNLENALEAAEKQGDLIAFGRKYISNVSLLEQFCCESSNTNICVCVLAGPTAPSEEEFASDAL